MQLSQKNISFLILLGAQAFLGAVLIYVFHRGYLAPSFVDTGVIFLLALIGALYRPRWAFYFFVGFLPFEIISLAPADFAQNLRAYQLLAVAVFFAGIIAVFRGQIALPRLHVADGGVAAIFLGGVLAHILSDRADMGQLIVLASFVFLYCVTRLFIQKPSQAVKPLLFFGLSGVLVSLYAILQNWVYMRFGGGHAVMPGRPNATFTEADWLGMFLVFLIALIYAFSFYFSRKNKRKQAESLLWKIILSITLFLSYLGLILTVARSAWLGALAVTLVYLAAVFWKNGIVHSVKSFFLTATLGTLAVIFALSIPLTDFRLGERAASVSGLQVITVSCASEADAAKLENRGHVETIAVLTEYNCRHINLEEIQSETQQGNAVTEITRDDPNVHIRSNTYVAILSAIMERPLVGHGWGSSAAFLGADEAGTQLNTSNIFLETWLSSGLLGFFGLLVMFFYAAVIGARNFLHEQKALTQTSALLILLLTFGLGVTNLFNAGLFLGFFWLYIGLLPLLSSR